MKRITAILSRGGVALAALIMALTLTLPVVAKAEGAVAKIGETEYTTFDEAVKSAPDGATIELLADATTEGLNLSKDLTVNGGGHSLDFTKYGIALWGKALTFKDVNVTINGIGSTPYTAEWKWMTVCASTNASLTLDNATMTMDGANAGNAHAIYFCSNNKLNLNNGSNLTIKNYQQDALEWDGGDGGYNVNIAGGSTFVSDHNRSGFTGTFYATIDNSTVQVINSRGNGSNGTYYAIKNGSNVLFDGNTNWGISAWRIDMTKNSVLTATNNGYSGVWTRVLNVDSTCTLDVEGNGIGSNSFTTNAGIFFQGNGTYKSMIEQGANVTIKYNAGSGIYTAQSVCNLAIGSATITNNGSGELAGATYGGGVYNVGTMVLEPDVVIYNNHANNAGDDIYNSKVITFGATGTDWVLDDYVSMDAITGWYDDAEDTRWSAHENAGMNHVVSSGAGVYEGELALKAAHGLTVDYQFVGEEVPETAVVPDPVYNAETAEFIAAQQDAVDGWTFDGWYTDEACTNKWVDDILEASMTLYGTWTHQTVTVSYQYASDTKPSGMEPPVSETVFYGDPYTVAAAQSAEGWTFAGWYLTADCAGEPVTALNPTSDVVLYGKWEKIPDEPGAPAEPTKPSKPAKSAKAATPKTGDASTSAALLGGAAVVAAAAVAGGVALRKRQQ